MTVEVRASSSAVTHSYLVAGIPCAVTASSAVLAMVDQTYGAYRADPAAVDTYVLRVTQAAGELVVNDSEGRVRPCSDETDAAFAAIEGVVRHVTDTLAARGIYAIHAASLVHGGEGLIICGKSRSGKTTLALALVGRGLGLLSDEFALSAPDARTIIPYRRGLHVRPGTPELVEGLAFLNDRAHHPLSGGFQWTLSPEDLEQVFPSCLAEAAPLRHVVLLEPRAGNGNSTLETVPKGIAAVELVRSTTAAATDLPAVLQRMTSLVADVRCVRMRPGRLESSVELILDLVGDRG